MNLNRHYWRHSIQIVVVVVEMNIVKANVYRFW